MCRNAPSDSVVDAVISPGVASPIRPTGPRGGPAPVGDRCFPGELPVHRSHEPLQQCNVI